MDEFLIRAWNEVAQPHDVVFHLGDFSIGLHNAERVRAIYSRLMGRKVLILGNHDYDTPNSVHPVIASLDWDQPPTQQREITDEGERVFLCHYPCRSWPGDKKGAWHFYGHTHGEMPPFRRSRDVGVDCPDTGFAPQTFRKLKRSIMESLGVGS